MFNCDFDHLAATAGAHQMAQYLSQKANSNLSL